MHSMAQKAVAEALGTAALVLVGPGSVVATLVLAGKATPAITEADLLGIFDGKAPAQLGGLVVGGVVVAIILVLGPITGASLNPARALGPELVATIGSGTTHWAQYVPVYLVPGLVGAALAALTYDWLNTPAGEKVAAAATETAAEAAAG